MASHLPSDEEIILLCRDTRNSHGRGFAKISESAFVKFGIDITLAEAATQEYAWKHVDRNAFHVPQPYRYFQDKSLGPGLTIGYLVMEYIDGISMSIYLEYATPDERKSTIEAIVGVLSHLAKVPVPIAQGPGPVGGGPPRGYLWSDGGIESTFAYSTDLENWLNQLLITYQPGYQGDLFDFTASKLSMCHTDLAPRNIIRKPNGQLAVLDWGSAGFYPHLFEIYAFRTRADREPIFTQILSRLDQDYDESQIQLLSKVERLLLLFGDAINLKSTSNSQQVIAERCENLSHPPPFRPAPGHFIDK